MRLFTRLVFAVCAVCLQAAIAANSYKELTWDDLVPEDWHPERIFNSLNIDEISDDDPRVQKVMDAFMKEWNQSPTNPKIDGLSVKLPGYVAPLDWEDDEKLAEFLLVPYFGACIHVPPPPPNQIIHVKPKNPLKGVVTMDTVWIYGVIRLETGDSGSMGTSGYAMSADKVELYIMR
ncbi:MAG: DUF3299 domain-containing protein [Helicobacteraceae bacterium]|jgi:hypothetical protein|nr:DUF3299 domain-containing protein [Helicobacteraceae bacterium]